VNSRAYKQIALVLAATIAVLGFALLLSTALHGGGATGYLIGAMFVALGSGRIYLLKKRR
jgi:hypothetical protein